MAAASHSMPSVGHAHSGGNSFVIRRGMATETFERKKKHANIGSIGHVDHGTLWAAPLGFACGCTWFRGRLCSLLSSGVRLGEQQPSNWAHDDASVGVVWLLSLWRWTLSGKTTLTSAITKVLAESGGATFIDYANIDKVRLQLM